MNDDQSALEDFSGIARLFPLPNLVLFPRVMQPLHIFEPRYRQMTRAALDDDRLLALALLKPGWEKDYNSNPAIHSVVCLGRIAADQELDDGRFNLMVHGLRRAGIVDELQTGDLFRSAKVELLDEVRCGDEGRAEEFREQIRELLPLWFAKESPVAQQFQKLIAGQMDSGALCDIISYALPMSPLFKQQLLSEVNVQNRCTALLQHMHQKKNKPFPPQFSIN